MTNIIYISKRCPHCKKLLIMIYKNSTLKDMFRIIPIENNQPPPFIKSVPTLYNTNNNNVIAGNDLFNQTASAMDTSGKGGMPDISKMADMLKMVGGGGGDGDSTESQLDEIFSDKPAPKTFTPSGDRNEQARQRLQRKLQQRKNKK